MSQVFILDEPLRESSKLRVFKIMEHSATEMTSLFVSNPSVTKKLFSGSIWVRGSCLYGAKYNAWVPAVRDMFGPNKPQRDEKLRKAVRLDKCLMEEFGNILSLPVVFLR